MITGYPGTRVHRKWREEKKSVNNAWGGDFQIRDLKTFLHVLVIASVTATGKAEQVNAFMVGDKIPDNAGSPGCTD